MSTTRRDFIKTTAMAAFAFNIASFNDKSYTPLLSFSTLGCPDWNLATILKFAERNGYNGIEFRGLQRQLDLSRSPEFITRESLMKTLDRIKERNLKVVNLGASTELHHADPAIRKKNIEEAKRFIVLAQQLSCPYVRVFPNNLPKDKDKNATLDLIASGLKELGEYADRTGVSVLMETHGDAVQSADIDQIMKAVNRSNVGLVWDIVNMWSVTKEPVSDVYAKLKNYIRHVHIKDLKFKGTETEYVLIGRGDTPIFEGIDILAKDRFKGYYSFEWEELWHPNIIKPEVALADYPKTMKNHFKTLA